MNDHNLNKRFFTEADSPVPLLPTDMAWTEMQKKLDPEEKKRRFIIWIPPIGCLLFVLLFTGAAVVIWSGRTKQTVAVNKPKQPRHNQNIFTPAPTLTAQNQNKHRAQASQKPDNRHKPVKEKENTTGGDEERSLPLSFPERVTLTDSISVHAFIPLPATGNKPKKEDSVNKAVWVEAGLLWNVPVPVEGSDHYLLGPNGNKQPQQYLLPGIWLSVNKNKQRLLVSANPFVSAPLPNTYYGKGMAPLNDSMPVYAQKRMVKMFGYQASLQYGYKLGNNIWLSGGISANWYRKGLVYARPADSIVTFNSFIYSVKTKQESEVSAFQMSANAAVSYQFKNLEAVLQVNAPFSASIKKVQSPLWIQLGIRWRLLAHPLPQ